MITEYKKQKVISQHIKGIKQVDIAKKEGLTINEIQNILDRSFKLRRFIRDGVTFRKCTSCKNEKQETRENFEPRSRGGYYSHCRDCKNTKRRVRRREGKEDLEKKRKRNYDHYHRNKEKNKERCKAYYQKNKKRISERKKKKYMEKTLELIKQKRGDTA